MKGLLFHLLGGLGYVKEREFREQRNYSGHFALNLYLQQKLGIYTGQMILVRNKSRSYSS